MASKDPSTTSKFTYTLAASVLSETEKNRLLCMFLNAEIPKSAYNWDNAAKEFNSASTNSFRVMVSEARKKIKDAIAKHEKGELSLNEAAASTPKSKGGRKRKVAAADDEEGTPTPTPTKKRAPRAKVKQETLDDESSGPDAGLNQVKEE